MIFITLLTQNAFAKPLVVTSTFILSSLVNEISQGKVNTAFIVPENENPHLFNPTPKDIQKLKRANLFIGVGYDGFEFWFNKVKNNIKGKILMLSDNYQNPIDKKTISNEILANPHIWLDMDFMKNTGVFEIANRLCSIDKTNCPILKTMLKN